MPMLSLSYLKVSASLFAEVKDTSKRAHKPNTQALNDFIFLNWSK